MKDLIISLAVNGRERYEDKVKGLEQTIIDANWHGEVRIYKEFPEWCTPHSKIPYRFKYDLIVRAIKDSYARIFWVDSSIRLIKGKNISELLYNSDKGIVAFHNLGFALEHWINDTAVKNLGVTYEEVKNIGHAWGGVHFWDFTKEIPTIILNEMIEQSKIGSFDNSGSIRKDFSASRNDQSVISVLLHKRNVPLLPYGVIAAKKDITENTYIQYAD